MGFRQNGTFASKKEADDEEIDQSYFLSPPLLCTSGEQGGTQEIRLITI